MDFVKEIEKEWNEHKKKHSKDYEWFECNKTSAEYNFNYSIGCEIIDNKGKSTILKTKEEAEEYSKKEIKKFGECSICDRFQRLIIKAKK